MARPPSDRDEGFLRRWSRLKQEAGDEPVPTAAPVEESRLVPQPAPNVGDAPPRDEKKAPGKEPFDPAQLPSVDSLTKDSDYSMFMRSEVPEDLRQKALRKLWASDPVLSAPEVLDMHNLDYNNVPTFPEGIKTLFRVGQGMLDAAEEEKTEEKGAEHGKAGTPASSPASGEESRDAASAGSLPAPSECADDSSPVAPAPEETKSAGPDKKPT